MQDFQFSPLRDRVVLKTVATSNKTEAGVLIPETSKEKPSEGVVIAVGEGSRTPEGTLVPMVLQPGDRVLFGKWSGTEIKINGQDYLLVKEDEILGRLTGEPAPVEEQSAAQEKPAEAESKPDEKPSEEPKPDETALGSQADAAADNSNNDEAQAVLQNAGQGEPTSNDSAANNAAADQSSEANPAAGEKPSEADEKPADGQDANPEFQTPNSAAAAPEASEAPQAAPGELSHPNANPTVRPKDQG